MIGVKLSGLLSLWIENPFTTNFQRCPGYLSATLVQFPRNDASTYATYLDVMSRCLRIAAGWSVGLLTGLYRVGHTWQNAVRKVKHKHKGRLS